MSATVVGTTQALVRPLLPARRCGSQRRLRPRRRGRQLDSRADRFDLYPAFRRHLGCARSEALGLRGVASARAPLLIREAGRVYPCPAWRSTQVSRARPRETPSSPIAQPGRARPRPAGARHQHTRGSSPRRLSDREQDVGTLMQAIVRSRRGARRCPAPAVRDGGPRTPLVPFHARMEAHMEAFENLPFAMNGLPACSS